jgi:hypothetical protein
VRSSIGAIGVAIFCRFWDGAGLRNGIVAPEFAFDHHAIGERAQERIGVDVGRVVAADVPGCETEAILRDSKPTGLAARK